MMRCEASGVWQPVFVSLEHDLPATDNHDQIIDLSKPQPHHL